MCLVKHRCSKCNNFLSQRKTRSIKATPLWNRGNSFKLIWRRTWTKVRADVLTILNALWPTFKAQETPALTKKKETKQCSIISCLYLLVVILLPHWHSKIQVYLPTSEGKSNFDWKPSHPCLLWFLEWIMTGHVPLIIYHDGDWVNNIWYTGSHRGSNLMTSIYTLYEHSAKWMPHCRPIKLLVVSPSHCPPQCLYLHDSYYRADCHSLRDLNNCSWITSQKDFHNLWQYAVHLHHIWC